MNKLTKILGLIIRTGFWGPLYYNESKEPKMVLVIIWGFGAHYTIIIVRNP